MADERQQSEDQPDVTGVPLESQDSGLVTDPSDQSPQDAAVAEAIAHTIDVEVLADLVEQQEAADAADTLEALEDDHRRELIEEMEDDAAALTLSEMNRPLAISVVQDLITEGKDEYASHLLEVMAPDDAADLLQGLDHHDRDHLLASIPAREAAQLRRLARYDVDSAGGLMTIEFTALRDHLSVAQAIEELRGAALPRDMQHLMVVDDQDHLVGVVGLRELLLNHPNALLADIMEKSVKAVRVETDREEVAAIFDRYDYYMLAVVDAQDRLLGIVTVDDIIDTIRAEQTEDVQKTVGAGAGEAVYSDLRTKLRGRFPWLGLSLLFTCFAGAAVLVGEDLIKAHPVLAFLLPVIAALVGNAGHQALAVTLRGIVLNEVRPERIMPLIAREGAVGLLSGVALGIGIMAIVTALSNFIESATWRIGLVAGIAAMVAMGVGTLAGSGIPLLMRRLGFDPAQSSAIFLIMVTDAVSFTTLLALTTLFIG